MFKDVSGRTKSYKIYWWPSDEYFEMTPLSQDRFESNDMMSVTNTYGDSKVYSASMMSIRLAQHTTVYTVYLSIHPFIQLSKLSCVEVRMDTNWYVSRCSGCIIGRAWDKYEMHGKGTGRSFWNKTEIGRWDDEIVQFALNIFAESCWHIDLIHDFMTRTWDLPEIDMQSKLPWGVWYQDARPEVWWLCCSGLEGYPVLVCVANMWEGCLVRNGPTVDTLFPLRSPSIPLVTFSSKGKSSRGRHFFWIVVRSLASVDRRPQPARLAVNDRRVPKRCTWTALEWRTLILKRPCWNTRRDWLRNKNAVVCQVMQSQ